MKFFQKRSVAILVLFAAILASIGIGQLKKPSVPVTLPENGTATAQYTYVYDYADILSVDTENYITKMNNGLYGLTGGQIVVVTIDEYDGDLSAFAMELGDSLGVGSSERNNGLVLLLDTEKGDDSIAGAVAVQGDGILHHLTNDMITDILINHLQEPFYSHNYNQGVTDTLDAFIHWYENYYGVNVLPRDQVYYQPVDTPTSPSQLMLSAVLLLLLLFLLWWCLDYLRYSSYRRRYWQPGMGIPPVVYRPVFWGRHMSYRPPPVHSPSGQHKDHDPHDGPFGGFGGGSFTGGSRGGGFGGRSGGGFSGGSRGGGFGGR